MAPSDTKTIENLLGSRSDGTLDIESESDHFEGVEQKLMDDEYGSYPRELTALQYTNRNYIQGGMMPIAPMISPRSSSNSDIKLFFTQQEESNLDFAMKLGSYDRYD